MDKEKIKILPIIVTVLLQLAVTLICIAVFALIINMANIDYKYSPVFGSIAVAIGSFASAYFSSAKKKAKGYIWGLLVGIITFALVTLIGLILSDSGISINTLFHLIIILLSSLIGGVMGVNKKGKKYI